MKFEIVLANGASLATNRADEIEAFFNSGGEAIANKPPKAKSTRKRKRVKK